MNMKKIMSMTLALIMMIVPVVSMAESLEALGEYGSFQGKIKEVRDNEGKISILVANEVEEMVFHVGEDVKVFDMTKTKENKMLHLVEGAEVEIFYPKNTPVTMSLPGQMTPEVIVVKNGDLIVKVDLFNGDLISSDNTLKLNLEDGENYKNSVLFVLYKTSTKSIPAQTSPEIVVKVKDKVVKPEPRLENKSNYKTFEGIVESFNLDNNKGSILVASEDEKIRFLIDENVLIDDMRLTRENKIMNLELDAKLTVVFKKNTPVMESFPAQMRPSLVLIHNDDAQVKVDLFNKDLVSSDNTLKLNVDNVDYKNKELVVIYKEATFSIPAQTTAEKIIVLEENIKEPRENGNLVVDKVNVLGKDIDANVVIKDDMILLPLREISEALGFEVKWNGMNKPIELTKGAQFTSVTIGENSYFFGKMAAFELEAAPEVIESKTYIPSSFISEILKAESFNIVDGKIEIK